MSNPPNKTNPTPAQNKPADKSAQIQVSPENIAKAKVKDLLGSENFRSQLAAALPKHLTPDRMVRVVITAGMKTPNLFLCTQESLFLAVLNCAAVGLEPDGRHAHLIPFRNNRKGIYECQLIFGYQGLCELVYRSGMVSNIHADIVCDNDLFKVNAGQLQVHTINYKKERGIPYAAYAIVRFKDGSHIVEVMPRYEIEDIRNKSQGYQAFKANKISSSPWVDSPGEMWKKTAVRRVIKWCPQSADIMKADDIEKRAEVIDLDAAMATQDTSRMLEGAMKSAEDQAIIQSEGAAGAGQGQGQGQGDQGQQQQGGQGQPAGGEKKDPPPATEPTPEEKAKLEAQRAKLREKIVEDLKGKILDGKASEAGLLKAAKAAKMPPFDKEEDFQPASVWELPTDTLAMLATPKP